MGLLIQSLTVWLNVQSVSRLKEKFSKLTGMVFPQHQAKNKEAVRNQTRLTGQIICFLFFIRIEY